MLHPMVAFSHDYDTSESQYLPRQLPPLTMLHPMVAFSHDYDTSESQYLPRQLPPLPCYTSWWHSSMTMIPVSPSTSRDGYPLTMLHPMVAFSHDYDTSESQYLPRQLPPLTMLHPMVAFSHDYDTSESQYLPRQLPPLPCYTSWWHSSMTMIPVSPSASRDGYPLTMLHPMVAFSHDYDTSESQYLPRQLPPLTMLHLMVAFFHDYDTSESQYLQRWLPPYHATPHGGILP